MVRKSKNDALLQLGEAARTLVHEIKNPLAAMTIQSELLRNEIPEEFHCDLDLLDHEIKRLTDLTNDIGDYLKNPVGTVCEIELISFVKEIVRLFPNSITVDCGLLSKAFIQFDKERARSVFENLIKNACESSEEKDSHVEVIIRPEKKKIVIDVCDRGNGIADEIKDKLFDPFFTTKQNGSGIGLSISRQFIRAGKGSLNLFNRDGGGTIARVILPGKTELKK